MLPNGQPRPAPTERTDNPALVFSAAQQDQTAKEMPLTGGATEPHGAFTAALIEALQALPADTPASLVYERVKAVLEGSNVPDQDPDLDATAARRQQPLFGGAAAKSGKIRAAALGTADDGSVVARHRPRLRHRRRQRIYGDGSRQRRPDRPASHHRASTASRAPRPRSSARRAPRLRPAISSS